MAELAVPVVIGIGLRLDVMSVRRVCLGLLRLHTLRLLGLRRVLGLLCLGRRAGWQATRTAWRD